MLSNLQLRAGNNATPKKAFSCILVLLLLSSAFAETRPRYGGTLHVEMRAAPASLDPTDSAMTQVAPLIYDTLIGLEPGGRLVPVLASSWQQEGESRWRFLIRSGVRFSDGTELTTAVVAQSLRESNPDWTVTALDDSVVIESGQPLPELPAVLALACNSIVLRSGGKLLGTGPFRVGDFQSGRRLVLTAREDGWHSRPFIDTVEILLNRGARDQMLDFQLSRADVVEVAPNQFTGIRGREIVAMSEAVDLLALRFSHSNVRDVRIRQAIALAIDRDSIVTVLLQQRGEAAAGLLPNWITGYSFLFPVTPQLARARQLRAEAKQATPLTLVYDAADPLARLVAERVALNAADAGITLKTAPGSQNIVVPDIELVRLRLPSTDPAVALAELARTDRLAVPLPEAPLRTLADVYRSASAALQECWAVPIAYLPAMYGLSPRVRNWTRTRDGRWRLADVWLGVPANMPAQPKETGGSPQ